MTRYPYAIGGSAEWVKVYLYLWNPMQADGHGPRKGVGCEAEGEGGGGSRVDLLALIKATQGVAAVHKASLRILFKVRSSIGTLFRRGYEKNVECIVSSMV